MPKTSLSNKASRAHKAPSRSKAAFTKTSEGGTAVYETSLQESVFIEWRGVYLLVPAALAFVFSINTLWNGFASDDSHQVLRNEFIRSISNIPFAFTTSVWSFATDDIVFSVDPYYRPVFNILLTTNYALFGTAAWGWHLTNVLIHTAATLLVFMAFKEATDKKWLAVISASLFAVHPAHAESVAWVSGITDPLMAVFLLPAFYFYLRFRKGGPRYLIVVALGFYILALFSKETALALPLIIAHCDLFYFKQSIPFSRRIVRLLSLAGLFALPTAAYFLLRYAALSGLFGNVPRYPLGPALATIPLATVKYLALMLIPVGYSYQHFTLFVESMKTIQFIGPVALTILLILGIALIRSHVLTLAAVWFIATLAPSLYAIRQFTPESLVQERYLYLPSMGFCLAAALAIEWLAARRLFAIRGRVLAAVAFVMLIAAWGAAYMKQNRVWQNDVTVFKNCVVVDPRSPVAHSSLARSYYDVGRLREAEEQARTAFDLGPWFSGTYLSMSYFAHRSGKLDAAIEYLELASSAVNEGPMTRYRLGTVYLNLGLLYWQRKNFDRAEESLLRSIESWPRPVGWYHAGQFYFDQGRYEDAQEMFELTLHAVPRWFAPVHLKLGQVYERLGQPAQARAAYEKFLEISPPNAENRNEVMRRLSRL